MAYSTHAHAHDVGLVGDRLPNKIDGLNDMLRDIIHRIHQAERVAKTHADSFTGAAPNPLVEGTEALDCTTAILAAMDKALKSLELVLDRLEEKTR